MVTLSKIATADVAVSLRWIDGAAGDGPCTQRLVPLCLDRKRIPRSANNCYRLKTDNNWGLAWTFLRLKSLRTR